MAGSDASSFIEHQAPSKKSGILRALGLLAGLKETRNLALVLIFAAIASAITTYVVMTRSQSLIGPDPEVVLGLALVNLVLLLALIAVVARGAFTLWLALKRGSVGSRLQTRIVVIFSIITMVPTVTVATFSALFLNASIEAWFSDKINTGLEESVAVAEAYLEEHKDIIRADARAMASDLDRALYEGLSSQKSFNQFISSQAMLRSLTEAAIIQNGQILARTNLTFSLAFEQLPPEAYEVAKTGQMVVIADDDKIRAVVKLTSLDNSFLIIGRLIDGRVINHMKDAQSAVKEYRAVRKQLSSIQVQFSLLFVVVALLLLLATVWYGMFFAAKLVVPISHLIRAAERVRAGDYATRVDEGPDDDELATLGRAFNRMTNQLASQRRELMKANRQLDSRRRFTEAVLSGVSAGVLALDKLQVITLFNRSAKRLLQIDENDENDSKDEPDLHDWLPEAEPLLHELQETGEQFTQSDLTIMREGKPITLHVRVAVQEFDGQLEGYILTFDDITPLVSAQRHAAWADVARRVAHEIKNPLTPIQLSAQRLKRKYLKQVEEADQENFSRYTDTIIRHVSDIGKMVEEFVNFARMRQPTFAKENISDLIKKTVFSEETAHQHVDYTVDVPEKDIFAEVDASQIRQVITNLVKNAAEAVEASHAAGKGGHVTVSNREEDGRCVVEVQDNGPGFPEDQLHRLLEPYVTTRAKGTGLGLAIVKKIMEDHKGRIELENAVNGGALVRLVFPLRRIADEAEQNGDNADQNNEG